MKIEFLGCQIRPQDAANLPHSWILDGIPKPLVTELSKRGSISTGFWSCDKGHFNYHYAVDEVIHILEGDVIVRDLADPMRIYHHLTAGDSIHFPKGSSAEWNVQHYVRKFWVINESRSRFERFANMIGMSWA